MRLIGGMWEGHEAGRQPGAICGNEEAVEGEEELVALLLLFYPICGIFAKSAATKKRWRVMRSVV